MLRGSEVKSLRGGRASIGESYADVKDGEVFPLARELEKRGTQIIFHSGHALEDQISASFPEAAFCPKPTNGRQLGNCLMELLAKNADENAERSH